MEQALFDAIEDGRHSGARPTVEASAPQFDGDAIAVLSKLGELKAAGVLTEEEFNVKKAELLARL
ncbi:hypothetical protein D3C76_1871060 [compost metagenome]